MIAVMIVIAVMTVIAGTTGIVGMTEKMIADVTTKTTTVETAEMTTVVVAVGMIADREMILPTFKFGANLYLFSFCQAVVACL